MNQNLIISLYSLFSFHDERPKGILFARMNQLIGYLDYEFNASTLLFNGMIFSFQFRVIKIFVHYPATTIKAMHAAMKFIDKQTIYPFNDNIPSKGKNLIMKMA